MTGIDVACGEVPWERHLLDAAAAEGVQVRRRHVDLDSAVRDAANSDALIISPALRGFAERPLRALVTSGVRVIVVLDSIRPPWLSAGGFDVREVADIEWPQVLRNLEQVGEPDERTRQSGLVTVFVGVSGGVGCSTLAAAHAASQDNCLLIDADGAMPSLAFLHGHPTDAVSFTARPTQRLLAPSQIELESTTAADVLDVISDAAAAHGAVAVDAGMHRNAWTEPLLARADRVVVVASATPLGIVRLCAVWPRLPQPAGGIAIVLNRVRDSAVGSGNAARVLRDLVELELHHRAHVVPDLQEICDAAWLRAAPHALASLVGALTFE